ncbi:MAG: hypothetical protein GY705_06545 [Bacteroidetes bacterium]|nr:hypothetical protein [Bacteroidota bacterium]
MKIRYLPNWQFLNIFFGKHLYSSIAYFWIVFVIVVTIEYSLTTHSSYYKYGCFTFVLANFIFCMYCPNIVKKHKSSRINGNEEKQTREYLIDSLFPSGLNSWSYNRFNNKKPVSQNKYYSFRNFSKNYLFQSKPLSLPKISDTPSSFAKQAIEIISCGKIYDKETANAYNYAYHYSNTTSPFIRLLCTILLTISLACLSYISIQFIYCIFEKNG